MEENKYQKAAKIFVFLVVSILVYYLLKAVFL